MDDAPRYVAPDDFDLPFGQRSKTPPRPTVPDGWAPNELASYIGDSWVPPAFDPTTPFLIAPPLEPAEPTVPNASRTKVLVAALAAAVVLVIGVPRLLNSDTPATTVKAPAAQVADLSQTSVPQTDAEAADLAVRAAARRASQNNFGTDNSSFQGRKGTAEQLAYVSLLEPTSVRLLAPDMLNGVMHTHLSALVSSSALSSAWPATAKSQALLARAIDDQFPLDIWLDPAGNLAKVTIQMADDGTGSQVVLAYS